MGMLSKRDPGGAGKFDNQKRNGPNRRQCGETPRALIHVSSRTWVGITIGYHRTVLGIHR